MSKPPSKKTKTLSEKSPKRVKKSLPQVKGGSSEGVSATAAQQEQVSASNEAASFVKNYVKKERPSTSDEVSRRLYYRDTVILKQDELPRDFDAKLLLFKYAYFFFFFLLAKKMK